VRHLLGRPEPTTVLLACTTIFHSGDAVLNLSRILYTNTKSGRRVRLASTITRCQLLSNTSPRSASQDGETHVVAGRRGGLREIHFAQIQPFARVHAEY
jgi:hypothetical protein